MIVCNRNSEEMKPLNDSPIDQIALDHERNSFMNGNDTNSDDTEELPPPPVIDSKDEPYPEYIDTGKRTPTPPPSPVISPYRSPRPITPENGTLYILYMVMGVSVVLTQADALLTMLFAIRTNLP